ncbi:MAG: tRNA lysidine(34) synthetase TilS [Ruminococcaceae bacterium]|nr:tRNA lysidine(34) synthetase TilS [Oscillospiraceae bacterium]
MKNKCLHAVAQYNMFNDGDRVVVAFSGGADSVALLHFLHTYAKELGITVLAAHFNHGIRGTEADEDALFCEQFCEQYGICFVTQKADVPAEAEARHLGTEECARILRYEFLQSVADHAKIATAHTNSDSCESFLFNFARGTGLQGLCGIPAVRGNIIRPCIYCSAVDTRQYCKENGLSWREDSTNAQTKYTRNKIRLKIIPHLKEVNTSFEENALRCMRILQAENDFLQGVTVQSYEQCKDGKNALLLEPLSRLHPAVATRVLMHFVQQHGCENVSMRQISLLMQAKNGEVVTFSDAIRFKKQDGRIFLVEPMKEMQPLFIPVFAADSVIPFFDTYVYFKVLPYNNENIGNGGWILDADKIGTAVLRTRLPGDRIRLPKRNCTKTLKQLFTEKKIPIQQRALLPVLADENGVIWVAGFGVDETRLPDKYTRKIIKIEWSKTI